MAEKECNSLKDILWSEYDLEDMEYDESLSDEELEKQIGELEKNIKFYNDSDE